MDKYVFVWNCCQPPCEAVSWNNFRFTPALLSCGQPPCEAVSWNTNIPRSMPCEALSASLWGCELKLLRILPLSVLSPVSLLVRLWVEIRQAWWLGRSAKTSASLWGCELKCAKLGRDMLNMSQPPCEAVSWNLDMPATTQCLYLSASLWGCELKYLR